MPACCFPGLLDTWILIPYHTHSHYGSVTIRAAFTGAVALKGASFLKHYPGKTVTCIWLTQLKYNSNKINKAQDHQMSPVAFKVASNTTVYRTAFNVGTEW